MKFCIYSGSLLMKISKTIVVFFKFNSWIIKIELYYFYEFLAKPSFESTPTTTTALPAAGYKTRAGTKRSELYIPVAKEAPVGQGTVRVYAKYAYETRAGHWVPSTPTPPVKRLSATAAGTAPFQFSLYVCLQRTNSGMSRKIVFNMGSFPNYLWQTSWKIQI